MPRSGRGRGVTVSAESCRCCGLQPGADLAKETLAAWSKGSDPLDLTLTLTSWSKGGDPLTLTLTLSALRACHPQLTQATSRLLRQVHPLDSAQVPRGLHSPCLRVNLWLKRDLFKPERPNFARSGAIQPQISPGRL